MSAGGVPSHEMPAILSAEEFRYSDCSHCLNTKANANEALGGLHDAISKLLTKHLGCFVVVAGEFNHTSLKAEVPHSSDKTNLDLA